MILNIDHIVLTINDMEKTIPFYRDVLRMTVKEFQPVGGGEMRKSLSFGNQKINLHHVKSPFKPNEKNPLSGTTDICFLSSTPLQTWQSIFLKNGIEIEDGPVKKFWCNRPHHVFVYKRSRQEFD